MKTFLTLKISPELKNLAYLGAVTEFIATNIKLINITSLKHTVNIDTSFGVV